MTNLPEEPDEPYLSEDEPYLADDESYRVKQFKETLNLVNRVLAHSENNIGVNGNTVAEVNLRTPPVSRKAMARSFNDANYTLMVRKVIDKESLGEKIQILYAVDRIYRGDQALWTLDPTRGEGERETRHFSRKGKKDEWRTDIDQGSGDKLWLAVANGHIEYMLAHGRVYERQDDEPKRGLVKRAIGRAARKKFEI